MPDIYLEAQYSDGYLVREDDEDRSAYEDGRNVFFDILHGLPVAEHGPMVRLSLFTGRWTYSIDWRSLPAGSRPIRFKHMERDFSASGEPRGDPRVARIDFGYQFTDEQGNNLQEVLNLGFA